MNANELADDWKHTAFISEESKQECGDRMSTMLRQQQEQIDKLTAIVALRELMIGELKVRLKSEFEYVENLLKIQKGEANEL
jgi:hypothetical protein